MLRSHPSLFYALGGEKGLGAHQECLHWHGESQSASTKLTHYWRLISRVCCFEFCFRFPVFEIFREERIAASRVKSV